MSSTPIGVIFTDENMLAEVAYGASIVTNEHSTGIASGVAAACITHLASQGHKPKKIIKATVDFLHTYGAQHGYDPGEMVEKLWEVKHLLGDPPDIATPQQGQGWVGDEAVGVALYAFLRSPTDFRQTVLTAANAMGDADTLACIAGALSGAYNGVKAIPKTWKNRVETSKELHDLGARMHAMREHYAKGH